MPNNKQQNNRPCIRMPDGSLATIADFLKYLERNDTKTYFKLRREAVKGTPLEKVSSWHVLEGDDLDELDK